MTPDEHVPGAQVTETTEMFIEVLYLRRREWTVRRLAPHLRQVFWPICRSKGVGGVLQWRIMSIVMGDQNRIVNNSPVDAISRYIWHILFRGVDDVLNAARPMSDHAKHEKLTGAGRPLTFNVKPVCIPCFCPLCCILVDGIEKDVMKKPNVRQVVSIKAAATLQVEKEVLPLQTKAACDIVPKAFNPSVVNAPGS